MKEHFPTTKSRMIVNCVISTIERVSVRCSQAYWFHKAAMKPGSGNSTGTANKRYSVNNSVHPSIPYFLPS